ncbi:hypothetical protein PCE01_12340 [Pediococcus cellicola]|nr:hypothetical protein PCE01_12340 [Pediococcus cellicola]
MLAERTTVCPGWTLTPTWVMRLAYFFKFCSKVVLFIEKTSLLSESIVAQASAQIIKTSLRFLGLKYSPSARYTNWEA